MVALTYQSSAADNTAKTTYTFTSLGIGAENPAKRVFVAVDWRDNDNPRGTLSSATIGGVQATIARQHSLMASNLTGAGQRMF